MTATDDRPPFEDIAEEKAVLDRLRELREARDAADRALQDAIAEQRQAGMYWETMSTALNPCPAWCDGKCDTDLDGSVGHHSDMLQVAGPCARDGAEPVAWMDAFAGQKPGEKLPDPTFSIHTDGDYSFTADEVRLFAAVLLRQLERVTGSTTDEPRPASLAASLRGYRVPLDDRGQVADLGGYEPQNR